MARKIDWSKGKEFFFNHGEKVALGSCAFLALVMGLWFLWDARSAGRADGVKFIHEAYRTEAKRIRDEMARAVEPKIDDKIFDRKAYRWDPYTSKYVPSPYSEFPEGDSDKRGKPVVLPIRGEPAFIRMDYIAGLTFAHDYGLNLANKPVIRGLEVVGGDKIQPEQPPEKKEKKPKGVNVPITPLPPWAHSGVPSRMVVVHAVFPMKLQVEEFRKALRMTDQAEMFKNRTDLPTPLGIDVLKIETSPGGAKVESVLLGFDPKDDMIRINPKLEELLRESIYDEKSPEAFKSYLWSGLCMPMPKLANRAYPQFDFAGFDDVDWDLLKSEKKEGLMAGGGVIQPKEVGPALPIGKGRDKLKPPPMPFEGGPKNFVGEYKLKDVLATEVAKTDSTLASRLFVGKERRIDQVMNLYHALGRKSSEKAVESYPGMPAQDTERYFWAWDIDAPQAAGVNPGGEGVKLPPGGEGKKPPPKGEVAVAPVYPAWERDALVRFVDVDVKPGYSYQYAIRVRLANPNFGKDSSLIAFAGLAQARELEPSGWVKTDRISVPHEYFLYPVDQKLLDDWADDKGKKPGVAPLYKPELVNNLTSFQIHQWVQQAADLRAAVEPYMIGDWVVAEQQAVRKGDFIGRGNTLQAPVWNKLKDGFDVPQNREAKKDAPKGINVDLLMEVRTVVGDPKAEPDVDKGTVERKAPLLVDFTGGKRLNRNNALEEETAVDALVLMPDGTLKVMNSRDAAADQDRQLRVLQSRARIDELLNSGRGPERKEGPGLPIPPKKGGGGGG